MRTWLHRHPNAAVIVLAIVWIVQVATIGWNWRQGRWFLVALGTACAVWISVALERWWERT